MADIEININKFHNSKIYCIRNDIDDDVYIGSTTQALSKRMVKHRCSAKTQPDKMKITKKMNELGVEHFYIELIVECPCENIEQLRRIEGEYIRKLATINDKIAGRTMKEYNEDNKDHIFQIKKQYREANKETIRQKKKEYREANKEILAEKSKKYQEANKERIQEYKKQYREANKDKIREKDKIYYEANKAKLSAQRYEKKICECGCEYTHQNKKRHEQSKKHQAFLNQQSN